MVFVVKKQCFDCIEDIFHAISLLIYVCEIIGKLKKPLEWCYDHWFGVKMAFSHPYDMKIAYLTL